MPSKIGLEITNVSGFGLPGVIVGEFQMLSGETRYVVECVREDVPPGLLRFYRQDQLPPEEEE